MIHEIRQIAELVSWSLALIWDLALQYGTGAYVLTDFPKSHGA